MTRCTTVLIVLGRLMMYALSLVYRAFRWDRNYRPIEKGSAMCRICYNPRAGEVVVTASVRAEVFLRDLVRSMMEDGHGSFVRRVLEEEVIRWDLRTSDLPLDSQLSTNG